jgi:hypothetical protein
LIQIPLQKEADFKDCCRMITQMKHNMLSAMHVIAKGWRLITPIIAKKCFVKCDILTDHVSSNDSSAANLSEVEEDD